MYKACHRRIIADAMTSRMPGLVIKDLKRPEASEKFSCWVRICLQTGKAAARAACRRANCIWRNMMKRPLTAVALVLSLFTGCEYSSSVELRRTDAGERGGANAFAVSEAESHEASVVRITSPHEGEIIYDEVYHDMSWEAIAVPKDQRFVVFASDNFNHYLMYPFPRSGRTPGSYLQKNIRLATESDDWELVVCVANSRAISMLTSCAARRLGFSRSSGGCSTCCVTSG